MDTGMASGSAGVMAATSAVSGAGSSGSAKRVDLSSDALWALVLHHDGGGIRRWVRTLASFYKKGDSACLPNDLVVALGGIFRRASPRMRHRLTDEFDAAGPWVSDSGVDISTVIGIGSSGGWGTPGGTAQQWNNLWQAVLRRSNQSVRQWVSHVPLTGCYVNSFGDLIMTRDTAAGAVAMAQKKMSLASTNRAQAAAMAAIAAQRQPSLLPDDFFPTVQLVASKSPPPLRDILLDQLALSCIFVPQELPPNRPALPTGTSALAALTHKPARQHTSAASSAAGHAGYNFSLLAHRLARNGLLFRPRAGTLSTALSSLLPFGQYSPLHSFVLHHLLAHRLWGVLEVYVAWYDLKALSQPLLDAANRWHANPKAFKSGGDLVSLSQALTLDSWLDREPPQPDAALVYGILSVPKGTELSATRGEMGIYTPAAARLKSAGFAFGMIIDKDSIEYQARMSNAVPPPPPDADAKGDALPIGGVRDVTAGSAPSGAGSGGVDRAASASGSAPDRDRKESTNLLQAIAMAGSSSARANGSSDRGTSSGGGDRAQLLYHINRVDECHELMLALTTKAMEKDRARRARDLLANPIDPEEGDPATRTVADNLQSADADQQLSALLAKFFDVEACVDGSHFASQILHSSAVPAAARERALAEIQARREKAARRVISPVGKSKKGGAAAGPIEPVISSEMTNKTLQGTALLRKCLARWSSMRALHVIVPFLRPFLMAWAAANGGLSATASGPAGAAKDVDFMAETVTGSLDNDLDTVSADGLLLHTLLFAPGHTTKPTVAAQHSTFAYNYVRSTLCSLAMRVAIANYKPPADALADRLKGVGAQQPPESPTAAPASPTSASADPTKGLTGAGAGAAGNTGVEIANAVFGFLSGMEQAFPQAPRETFRDRLVLAVFLEAAQLLSVYPTPLSHSKLIGVLESAYSAGSVWVRSTVSTSTVHSSAHPLRGGNGNQNADASLGPNSTGATGDSSLPVDPSAIPRELALLFDYLEFLLASDPLTVKRKAKGGVVERTTYNPLPTHEKIKVLRVLTAMYMLFNVKFSQTLADKWRERRWQRWESEAKTRAKARSDAEQAKLPAGYALDQVKSKTFGEGVDVEFVETALCLGQAMRLQPLQLVNHLLLLQTEHGFFHRPNRQKLGLLTAEEKEALAKQMAEAQAKAAAQGDLGAAVSVLGSASQASNVILPFDETHAQRIALLPKRHKWPLHRLLAKIRRYQPSHMLEHLLFLLSAPRGILIARNRPFLPAYYDHTTTLVYHVLQHLRTLPSQIVARVDPFFAITAVAEAKEKFQAAVAAAEAAGEPLSPLLTAPANTHLSKIPAKEVGKLFLAFSESDSLLPVLALVHGLPAVHCWYAFLLMSQSSTHHHPYMRHILDALAIGIKQKLAAVQAKQQAQAQQAQAGTPASPTAGQVMSAAERAAALEKAAEAEAARNSSNPATSKQSSGHPDRPPLQPFSVNPPQQPFAFDAHQLEQHIVSLCAAGAFNALQQSLRLFFPGNLLLRVVRTIRDFQSARYERARVQLQSFTEAMDLLALPSLTVVATTSAMHVSPTDENGAGRSRGDASPGPAGRGSNSGRNSRLSLSGSITAQEELNSAGKPKFEATPTSHVYGPAWTRVMAILMFRAGLGVRQDEIDAAALRDRKSNVAMDDSMFNIAKRRRGPGVGMSGGVPELTEYTRQRVCVLFAVTKYIDAVHVLPGNSQLELMRNTLVAEYRQQQALYASQTPAQRVLSRMSANNPQAAAQAAQNAKEDEERKKKAAKQLALSQRKSFHGRPPALAKKVVAFRDAEAVYKQKLSDLDTLMESEELMGRVRSERQYFVRRAYAQMNLACVPYLLIAAFFYQCALRFARFNATHSNAYGGDDGDADADLSVGSAPTRKAQYRGSSYVPLDLAAEDEPSRVERLEKVQEEIMVLHLAYRTWRECENERLTEAKTRDGKATKQASVQAANAAWATTAGDAKGSGSRPGGGGAVKVATTASGESLYAAVYKRIRARIFWLMTVHELETVTYQLEDLSFYENPTAYSLPGVNLTPAPNAATVFALTPAGGAVNVHAQHLPTAYKSGAASAESGPAPTSALTGASAGGATGASAGSAGSAGAGAAATLELFNPTGPKVPLSDRVVRRSKLAPIRHIARGGPNAGSLMSTGGKAHYSEGLLLLPPLVVGPYMPWVKEIKSRDEAKRLGLGDSNVVVIQNIDGHDATTMCVLEDGEVDGDLLSAVLDRLFRMGHIKKAVQIAVKLLESPLTPLPGSSQPPVSLSTKKSLRLLLDMMRFVLWMTEPNGEPVSLDNLTFSTLPPLNPHRGVAGVLELIDIDWPERAIPGLEDAPHKKTANVAFQEKMKWNADIEAGGDMYLSLITRLLSPDDNNPYRKLLLSLFLSPKDLAALFPATPSGPSTVTMLTAASQNGHGGGYMRDCLGLGPAEQPSIKVNIGQMREAILTADDSTRASWLDTLHTTAFTASTNWFFTPPQDAKSTSMFARLASSGAGTGLNVPAMTASGRSHLNFVSSLCYLLSAALRISRASAGAPKVDTNGQPVAGPPQREEPVVAVLATFMTCTRAFGVSGQASPLDPRPYFVQPASAMVAGTSQAGLAGSTGHMAWSNPPTPSADSRSVMYTAKAAPPKATMGTAVAPEPVRTFIPLTPQAPTLPLMLYLADRFGYDVVPFLHLHSSQLLSLLVTNDMDVRWIRALLGSGQLALMAINKRGDHTPDRDFDAAASVVRVNPNSTAMSIGEYKQFVPVNIATIQRAVQDHDPDGKDANGNRHSDNVDADLIVEVADVFVERVLPTTSNSSFSKSLRARGASGATGGTLGGGDWDNDAATSGGDNKARGVDRHRQKLTRAQFLAFVDCVPTAQLQALGHALSMKAKALIEARRKDTQKTLAPKPVAPAAGQSAKTDIFLPETELEFEVLFAAYFAYFKGAYTKQMTRLAKVMDRGLCLLLKYVAREKQRLDDDEALNRAAIAAQSDDQKASGAPVVVETRTRGLSVDDRWTLERRQRLICALLARAMVLTGEERALSTSREQYDLLQLQLPPTAEQKYGGGSSLALLPQIDAPLRLKLYQYKSALWMHVHSLLHFHLSALNLQGYVLLTKLEGLSTEIKQLAWRMEDAQLSSQAAECHHVYSLLQLQLELLPHHLQQRFNFVNPTRNQMDDIWMAFTRPRPKALTSTGATASAGAVAVAAVSAAAAAGAVSVSPDDATAPAVVVTNADSVDVASTKPTVPSVTSPSAIPDPPLPYSVHARGLTNDGLASGAIKNARRMTLEEMLSLAADMYLSGVTRAFIKRLWVAHEAKLGALRRQQQKESAKAQQQLLQQQQRGEQVGVVAAGAAALGPVKKLLAGYIFEKLHDVKANLYLYYQEKFEKILKERVERKRAARVARDAAEQKLDRTSGIAVTDAVRKQREERAARDLLDEDENLNRYLTRSEFFTLFFGVDIDAAQKRGAAAGASVASGADVKHNAAAASPTGASASASASASATTIAASGVTTLGVVDDDEERERHAVLGPRLPATVLLFVRDRLIWSLGVSRLNAAEYDSAVSTLDALGLHEQSATLVRLYEKHSAAV